MEKGPGMTWISIERDPIRGEVYEYRDGTRHTAFTVWGKPAGFESGFIVSFFSSAYGIARRSWLNQHHRG